MSRCPPAAGSPFAASSRSASCWASTKAWRPSTTFSKARSAPALDGDELSLPFLRALENSQTFETNPIFAVLHEMCYTQGAASRWSAERVRGEFPDTNWAPGKPPSFTGEMIYPWMFDDYPDLRPLRDVAGILAQDEQLAGAVRPGAACPQHGAVGRGDLRRGHVRAARAVGANRRRHCKGMKGWLTNEFEHSGLRTSDRVFERLLGMVRDKI